ncbi:MAG: class I SAM-dependent methyltransferase [Candidatus Rokubacteria bacterium]|nr:class I SAM-dependent methyltransferase [Candidatus Rokubacteria bacterium]
MPPPGVNPTFWRLLLDEDLARQTVVDVGTGAGRVALALAPRCRDVVGIDRDPALIADASRRAEVAGLANATFLVADADALPHFRDLTPDVARPDAVAAHMFLSDALIANAAASVPRGGVVVCCGFHVDHWGETGRPSRFAYDEPRMRARLESHGFTVEHLGVDRDVQQFPSLEAALAAAVGLEERWRSDGRWFRYIDFLEHGGRTLTQALVVAKGRRQ